MEYLFKKIQDKLTNSTAVALFIAKGLTPIKYFDLFKGQFQSPELFDILPLPAVLFQWSLNLEDKTVSVNLHFGYEQIRDTSQLSASQNNALKFFTYINTIHELVNRTESQNTSKLEAVSFEPIDLSSVGIAHQLNYKAEYTNNSNSIYNRFSWTAGDGDLEIQAQIIKQTANYTSEL